jgi:hypothetical protein
MSLDASLFVGSELHQRTVKLPDGSEHVMHFKELPATAFRSFHIAEQSQDEAVQVGSMAKLIAACLCNPDGTPAVTYAQALQLKTAPSRAIFSEVLSVNGIGEKGNG